MGFFGLLYLLIVEGGIHAIWPRDRPAINAMAAAIAMISLSMALIGTFLIGGGLLAFGAILVAVITAYALRLALAPPGQESDAGEAAANMDTPVDGVSRGAGLGRLPTPSSC